MSGNRLPGAGRSYVLATATLAWDAWFQRGLRLVTSVQGAVQFFVDPLRRSKAKMVVPPPVKRPVLLCVDDDAGMRELYEALLGSHGFEVFVAADARHALELFHSKEKEIEAVLLDYEMPGMNGVELAADLKRCNPKLPVIMVSGRRAVLEELPHFVDVAMGKGAPITEIVDQIKALRAIPVP